MGELGRKESGHPWLRAFGNGASEIRAPLGSEAGALRSRTDSTVTDVARFGGKGSSLLRLAERGLRVPAGVIVSTDLHAHVRAVGWDRDADAAIQQAVTLLEARCDATLGHDLAVSVRSGAASSMPGMLETVLGVGTTDAVRAHLAHGSGAEFAERAQQQAQRSFHDVVGIEPPADAREQLRLAAAAVLGSWDSDRAGTYRVAEGIDDGLGTALTIQSMVYGARNERSGAGVVFSRDPTTGAPGLYGEYLVQAPCDDVVAGTAQTLPLSDLARRWPHVHAELEDAARLLEHEYTDMVDIEFTVDDGVLWMLQARPAKRTSLAAVQCAVDMAEDPVFPLDRSGAVERCRIHLRGDAPPIVQAPVAAHGESPLGSRSDESVVARGIGASPGVATGRLCFDPDRAVELAEGGHDVVLVRRETSPADVHGMTASVAVFTLAGGIVSHAAVVARSWGLPAVVGAVEATLGEGVLSGPGGTVAEGDVVTVDGQAGTLRRGEATGSEVVPDVVRVLQSWAAGLDEDVGIDEKP